MEALGTQGHHEYKFGSRPSPAVSVQGVSEESSMFQILTSVCSKCQGFQCFDITTPTRRKLGNGSGPRQWQRRSVKKVKVTSPKHSQDQAEDQPQSISPTQSHDEAEAQLQTLRRNMRRQTCIISPQSITRTPKRFPGTPSPPNRRKS